ncbi:alpha/beta fold hydrolase [Streptomyces sp. NPDC059556]|uniref:alpha/beta fold hydrolase n=1 Tax=Streptomyces sp. NPDC059556 TaxID=3346863 RepID=UPI0036AAE302
MWDAVVPELARHHDVVRYDARGLGRSSLPTRPFDDVEDLNAVLDHFGLDHFGLDRAALVGLSMGGETALDFALAHPGRVSAPALVGTSVSGHDWPQDPQSSAYATGRRQRDAAGLAASELSVWASLGRTAPGGELIEAMVTDNAERLVADIPDADSSHCCSRIWPDTRSMRHMDRQVVCRQSPRGNVLAGWSVHGSAGRGPARMCGEDLW